MGGGGGLIFFTLICFVIDKLKPEGMFMRCNGR